MPADTHLRPSNRRSGRRRSLPGPQTPLHCALEMGGESFGARRRVYEPVLIGGRPEGHPMALPVERGNPTLLLVCGAAGALTPITGGATGKWIRGCSFGPVMPRRRARSSNPISWMPTERCDGRAPRFPLDAPDPSRVPFRSGPDLQGGEAGLSRRTKRPSLRAGWGATSLAGKWPRAPRHPLERSGRHATSNRMHRHFAAPDALRPGLRSAVEGGAVAERACGQAREDRGRSHRAHAAPVPLLAPSRRRRPAPQPIVS